MKTEQLQFFPGSVKRATTDCKSADLWKVQPERLHVDPGFNVRIKDSAYKARVRALADSMMANGYYNDKPMAGYVGRIGGEDVIIITDGHTRLEAVKLAISEGAQIEVVPVVTKPSGTSMEDLTVALVTGNNGSPLKPYEVAVVCKRLIDYGLEESDIANRLGLSPVYIQGLMLLMSAPAAVRKMVELDKVSATAAIDTLRKHGERALDILKIAAQDSEQSGGRVTPKQITKAREKQSGVKVVKLPKPTLVKSAGWLKEQGLHEDPAVLKFLSFLAGLPAGENAKALVDGLLKPKAPKPAAKVPGKTPGKVVGKSSGLQASKDASKDETT